jgi:hypothetical protein
MTNVTLWYNKVTKLTQFVDCFGVIKTAQKSLKPGSKLLVKEKPVEEKKVVAKKAEDDDDEPKEEKKAANPLDLLPPTTFDLYNFKTFFVNHKDKKGEAIDEMIK